MGLNKKFSPLNTIGLYHIDTFNSIGIKPIIIQHAYMRINLLTYIKGLITAPRINKEQSIWIENISPSVDAGLKWFFNHCVHKQAVSLWFRRTFPTPFPSLSHWRSSNKVYHMIKIYYRQTSNISHTLLRNKTVVHSDIVGDRLSALL